jgi:transcriptional regulator with XRE-family HTH domain
VLNLRLKEERVRLGLTQPIFAEFALAKKRTVQDWEKGVSSPTAIQLEALAKVGFDVLYLVTGIRSAPITEPAQAPLSREESVLLDNYRHSSPEAKAAIKATSDALTQSKSDKKTG